VRQTQVDLGSKHASVAANPNSKSTGIPVKSKEPTYQDLKMPANSKAEASNYSNNPASKSNFGDRFPLPGSDSRTLPEPSLPRLFVQRQQPNITPKMIDALLKNFENPKPLSKVHKVLLDKHSYWYDSYKHYKSYLQESKRPRNVVKATTGPDGRVETLYDNSTKETLLPTGVRKEVLANGYSIVHFPNGDIKQSLPEGTQIYFHKEPQITHITLPNEGIQVR
jgi:hypothetical protein